MRTVVLASLLLAACGDDRRAPADPDAGAPDAGQPDAAAIPTCAEPAVELSIGAEGGELTLCGGRLSVPPGALPDAITFGIAPSEAPAPAPPRALAGPALRFTPDDAPLPAAVDLALPHGGGAGRIELFAVDGGELFGIEACAVDDATIGQSVGLLGTFVATRDDYPYADGVDDLGDGTVSTTIGEREDTWQLPADGHAIDQTFGEAIALQLVLERFTENDGLEQLRVDLLIGEAAELAGVQWYDSDEGLIWQLGTPTAPGTTGVVELTRDGDRLTGTLAATLYAGEDTLALTATLDVTPEYFAFPPERFCGKGPKG